MQLGNFDHITDYTSKVIWIYMYSCTHISYEFNTFQESRTWLNIAESQELAGKDYQTVGSSYLSALAAARKAKHRKLQVVKDLKRT